MAKVKEPIKVTPRRESKSGFHYINLYQCCPRKFYIRYIKGWRPLHTTMQLIQGGAFHEAKAVWYKKKSKKQAIDIALALVEEAKKELASEEVYKELLFRLPHFIHYWIEAFGKNDLIEYKVRAVEKQLFVKLGNSPYIMTIRPDAILEQKSTKLKFLFETKTSGFSHRVTTEAVVYGDQITTYMYGIRKNLYPDLFGAIPDIAYWNSRSRDIGNMQFLRPEIIQRSEYAFEQFEKGMVQLFTEVNQKIAALKTGYSPEILFPRNTYYCLSYSKVCEYAGICNQDITKRRAVPPGLRKDKPQRKLGDLVDDIIAVQ